MSKEPKLVPHDRLAVVDDQSKSSMTASVPSGLQKKGWQLRIECELLHWGATEPDGQDESRNGDAPAGAGG